MSKLHGTLFPYAFDLQKNFVIIDTKGISVPSKANLKHMDLQDWWEMEGKKEFIDLAKDPVLLHSRLSKQHRKEIIPPQLVVLVAPATLFQRSFVLTNTTESVLQLDYYQQQKIIFSLWLQQLREIENVEVRVVLTHMDEVRNDNELEIKKNAGKELGCSESIIYPMTNYVGQEKPKDEIEEFIYKMTKDFFQIIESRSLRALTKTPLHITSAVYRKIRNRSEFKDVTEKLREKIENGDHIHINPHQYNKVLGGDPFQFYCKELFVEYLFLGTEMPPITAAEEIALDVPPKIQVKSTSQQQQRH